MAASPPHTPPLRGEALRPGPATLDRRLGAFAREAQGSATVELGIGVLALLTIAVALFALYGWIKTDASVPRAAVTMADYVSRESELDGAQLDALAKYLWKTDLAGREGGVGEAKPAAAFVISAIRGVEGDDGTVAPTMQWAETITFGDDEVSANLAAESTGHCAEVGEVIGGEDDGLFPVSEDGDPWLEAGQTVLLVDLCVRPIFQPVGFAESICHFHALPTRHPGDPPAEPVRAIDPDAPDPVDPPECSA